MDSKLAKGGAMKKIILSFASLLLTLPVLAQEPEQEPEPEPKPVPLSELAAAADLIAVVRVLDTDYQYTREFPSGGSAFLRVLIPYKVGRPLEDIIEVYEEGLHAGECYFENPTVLEEGRRHLVFLKFSPDVKDQYNGLDAGCRLDVLVMTDNRYALRYPPNGIGLADDLSGLASEMAFRDGYAVLNEDQITPPERIRLVESGYLSPEGEKFRFTHGIDMAEIRKLMGSDALTLDRSLK
jgi:hypothetical protein